MSRVRGAPLWPLAFLLVGTLVGPAPLGPVPVRAAAIAVTTPGDELKNDGDCSLREAVGSANTDVAVDACAAGRGADTITLPAGTYTLTLASPDDSAGGDLDITGDLTITGAGRDATRVVGSQDRALDVSSPATVALARLTVERSSSQGEGGGIRNRGTLRLDDVVVANNRYGGSGISSAGGGIYSSGSLAITNSSIRANSPTGLFANVSGTGGGIYNAGGSLTITTSTIADNDTTGDSGSGGGIYSTGTATLTDVVISGNKVGFTPSFGGGPVAF